MKRKRKKLSKRKRQAKYGSTYAAVKRRQRAVKIRPGQVRHHDSNGTHVISRKAHAAIHKRKGNAGGRPRTKKGKR